MSIRKAAAKLALIACIACICLVPYSIRFTINDRSEKESHLAILFWCEWAWICAIAYRSWK